MKKRSLVLTATRTLTSCLIILGCITFVFYQTYQCFEKYVGKPQGTKLSIDFNGRHKFPAITVCANPTEIGTVKPYNKEILDDCGIKRYQNNSGKLHQCREKKIL